MMGNVEFLKKNEGLILYSLQLEDHGLLPVRAGGEHHPGLPTKGKPPPIISWAMFP